MVYTGGGVVEVDAPLQYSLRNVNQLYLKQIYVWSSVSQQVFYE